MRLFCIISRFWFVSSGIALLAARPATPLSTASFAVYFSVISALLGKAFCSRKTAPTLNSCRVFGSYQTKKHPQGCSFVWCGRQELKTPIHLKSPLFIRLLLPERQSGRQKFLRKSKSF